VICPPRLANPGSTAQTDVARRAAFLTRITAYNLIETGICANVPRCRTDGGALFAWQFGADDLATVMNTGGVDAPPFNVRPILGSRAPPDSTADYWHPSARGQAAIAQLEWNAARLTN
jgi:hypothetical protein